MVTVMPAERSLTLSETLHIYTRVSTVVQADEGMSLDVQRDIGIDRAKSLGFEHKLWNETLAAQVRAGELDPHYYWQLEQQILSMSFSTHHPI